LKKLLQINRRTGIETRASICNLKNGFGTLSDAPTIAEQDRFFRKHGVDLAAQACRKALQEWRGNKDDITHTVAVTCMNQGNPGFDLLVHLELGLSPTVHRTLLHGVGCAGGLAILRTAAQLCDGATARGRPARILGFACELCTPNARQELLNVEKTSARDVSVAGALFSDGAAAFVLCNTLGLGDETQPLFELVESDTALIPGTIGNMSMYTVPGGELQIWPIR
jgi:type III polyketide synthase